MNKCHWKSTWLAAACTLLLSPSPSLSVTFIGFPNPQDGTFVFTARATQGDFAGYVEDQTGRRAVAALCHGGVCQITRMVGDLDGGAVNAKVLAPTDESSDLWGVGESDSGLEAMVWSEGVLQGLGDLPGGAFDSAAYGAGYGRCTSDQGQEACSFSRSGHPTGLGDLPGGAFESALISRRAMVGYGTSENGREAAYWGGLSLVSIGDLPGGVFDSVAHSAVGTKIVGYGSTDQGQEAFIWTPADGMRSLGDLAGGSVASVALDISDDGQVVAGYGTTDAGREAVVWVPFGLEIRSVKELLLTNAELRDSLSGWKLEEVVAVNGNAGHWELIGNGVAPNGSRSAWFATIPEPSSATLTSIGIALLSVAARPKRGSHQRPPKNILRYASRPEFH